MSEHRVWTAARVIGATIVWTLFSNTVWVLVVAGFTLAAVMRADWEAVSRHGLRGLYGCLATGTVVLACRSLYYRTVEGRGVSG